MGGMSWKLVTLVLAFVVVVQVYIGVVQVVEGFQPEGMLQPIVLKGSGKLSSGSTFSMGAEMRIIEESSLAATYIAKIYDNKSSVVCERTGRFRNSSAKEDVQLRSSTFSAGWYRITFDAFSCNVPIVGVQFSDSKSMMFQLTETETMLAINASFDNSSRVFEASANLTDRNGLPVVSENAEFSIRLAAKQRLTDGWIPVGSATTDAEGIANLTTGLVMPDDNYSVMAYHAGNSNFGESSSFTEIQIVGGGYSEGGCGMGGLSPLSVGLLFSDGKGTWSLTPSVDPPSATLPMGLAASYSIDCPLSGEVDPQMLFFLDQLGNQSHLVNLAAEVSYQNQTYTYKANMTWTPGATGLHNIIVGIANGSIYDMMNASMGIGLFDTAQCCLNVAYCPSVLLVQTAQAIGNATLPVTVGFFKPEPYKTSSTGFCAGSRIAPTLAYNQMNYTLDAPILGMRIHLLVNSTLWNSWYTGVDGLLVFPLQLNTSERYSCLNITAVTDDANMPYEGKSASPLVNFTTVGVHDAGGTGTSDFALNYSVFNCNQQADTIYVGEDPNTIRASANLFSLPVQNVVVNFSAAEVAGYGTVSKSVNRTIAVPNGADLLRVRNFTKTGLKSCQRIGVIFGNGQNSYLDNQNCTTIPKNADNVTLVVNPPVGDMNKDGCVDIYDAIRFANVFGTNQSSPNWNPDADLKTDNIIDIYDAIIFALNFGLTNDTAHVDQGTIEFLTTKFSALGGTDNSGVSSVDWYPAEAGTYLVNATIPSEFNVTVSYHSSVTEINASLSAIGYVSVVKRTVGLTIASPAGSSVQVLSAVADSYIFPGDLGQSHGSESQLLIGDYDVQVESWALVLFNVLAIPANAYIVSARLNVFGSCQYVEEGASLGVYRVLENWSESDVCWDNRPTFAQTPTVTATFSNDWTDKWLFLDVTEDVSLWHNGTSNNGFLLAKYTASSLLLTLNSKEASCNPPSLEVSYVTSAPALVVSAYDNVTTKPVDGLPVTININGMDFERVTNESGYASVENFYPSSDTPCNINVSSADSATYSAGHLSSLLDFRFPTNITIDQSIMNPRNVLTGLNYTYGNWLASSSLFGIEGALVQFRINGTFMNGTTYSRYLESNTVSNGSVSCVWAAPANGTYMVNATFQGSDDYKPCQVCLIVKANSIPLAVMFGVSPQEFVTGSQLVLQATILDPSTNMTVTLPSMTVEFLRFSSDGASLSLCNTTTINGVATANTAYLNNASTAYAYMARIVPAVGDIHQGIVCNPVQLTASNPSQILLNVTRDWSSQNHTLQGWLLSQSSGIGGRQVKVKVNETTYSSSLTNQSGYFCLSLSLQPVNNSATTYVVTTSFEDTATQPLSAMAWAKTLDGQQYAACTTTQYGYKPAYNTTTLTISAQSTEVMTTTKTPEEMQQEAEQNGLLRIWHEFSWFFPWYRMHFVFVYEGSDQFDQGISPIPLVGSTIVVADVFLNVLRDLWDYVAWPTAIAVASAEFFALLASNAGVGGFILACAVSTGLKFGSLAINWNSISGLVGGIIGSVFSTVVGMLKWNWGFISDFFNLLLSNISLAEFGLGNLYRVFSFPAAILYIGTVLGRLHELGAIS